MKPVDPPPAPLVALLLAELDALAVAEAPPLPVLADVPPPALVLLATLEPPAPVVTLDPAVVLDALVTLVALDALVTLVALAVVTLEPLAAVTLDPLVLLTLDPLGAVPPPPPLPDKVSAVEEHEATAAIAPSERSAKGKAIVFIGMKPTLPFLDATFFRSERSALRQIETRGIGEAIRASRLTHTPGETWCFLRFRHNRRSRRRFSVETGAMPRRGRSRTSCTVTTTTLAARSYQRKSPLTTTWSPGA